MHLAIGPCENFHSRQKVNGTGSSASNPALNPVGNLWWKWKKMAPTCKTDLTTVTRDRWNQLDEKYCSSLVRSMRQIIQVGIKTRSDATKYRTGSEEFNYFIV